MTTAETLRDEVRRRYAEAARSAGSGSGCGGGSCCEGESNGFGSGLYTLDQREDVPEAAARASLGCGNATAVAELREGEAVLDLGSGGGIDVIVSARRVGPSGVAYGLDMTEEMLALARRNAEEAGVPNAVFLKGFIEDVPLPAESVDVVISNCVINLSTDKPAVFAELARVLKPGGRIGISDVVAEDRLAQTNGPSAGATSAASPARSRRQSTRPRSPEQDSTRSPSHLRTPLPTACTARSCRRESSSARALGPQLGWLCGGLPDRDPLSRQRELDILPGLVDAPLDGGERDLERIGDLGVRESDDVAKQERHLQVVVEVVDGAPDGVDRLHALKWLVEHLERRQVLKRDRRSRPALVRPQLIEHPVLRHLEKPGREAAAKREVRQPLEDAEENFLR
jgi:arsenite methyltransferase